MPCFNRFAADRFIPRVVSITASSAIAAAAAIAAGTAGVAAAAEGDEVLVLTALPFAYSITSSLAAGTAMAVANIPEGGRPMSALEDLLTQRADRFEDQLSRADAVVTIGKLWRDDPLYTAARGANIRVVEIDATKPWSPTLEGVSVAFEPAATVPWAESRAASGEPSVYFWLSPANAIRSADIVARDLMRISPNDAERITGNLEALRRELLELKREYEVKLASLADVTVFSLAPELVYLTADMGIFVDGRFFKQDIDWTAEDLAAFEAYLASHEIPVVIHKWAPDQRIADAVEAGGAELVVLELIDIGIVEEGRLLEQSYMQLMRRNLDALYSALAAAGVSSAMP